MAVAKVVERWSFPVTTALGKEGEEPLSPTGNQVVGEKVQFHIVTLNTSGELALAVSGSETLFGLEDTPKQKEYGTVALVGVAKVVAAEAIKPGEVVSSNNTGEAQKVIKGQFVFGVALNTAAKGGMLSVLLHPGSGIPHA